MRVCGHPHVIPSPPIQSCFTSQLSFLCPYTNQHTIVNNSLTHTANHSLTPSFYVYFYEQRKWPLTSGTTYWKPCPSALPTSQWQSRLTSSDLYKRSHQTSEKQFIRKGVTSNTHQERTHQDGRYDSRLPGHVASWTGHTTARWASCSSTQHSRSPLNSTADLRQTNCVAGGSTSPAAYQRPCHNMANSSTR